MCIKNMQDTVKHKAVEDVLARVSMSAMKHHDRKANWEGKGLFNLYFHIAVYHQKKSRQELN